MSRLARFFQPADNWCALLAGLSLFSISTAAATVVPNSLFSDHMVLQQQVAVPVWGRADEGEVITVRFQNQAVTTTAHGGKWLLKMNKLTAGGPYTMRIEGSNTVIINDVLVGEVWLCSGQSNMERQLGPRPGQQPITNWVAEREAANHPQIRSYFVPHRFAPTPVEEAGGVWAVCSPETVQDFSAVGYFFAQALQMKIKVPVGILFSASGGTPAEYWTSRADLENKSELRPLVDEYISFISNYPRLLAQFEAQRPQLTAKFRIDSAVAVQTGRSGPRRPTPPNKERYIAGLYNAMIKPLQPYALKGVCWYQGESNSERPQQYRALLPAMISNWRRDWQLGNFPFLIVQIAPFEYQPPEIREAQLLVSQRVPNTALVVTTDVGDAYDIHPTNKKPVGQRLAVAAGGLAYGITGEYTAPTFEEMRVKGNTVELTFKHVGKGLTAKGEALRGFTLAGPDKQFVPAQAIIKGKKVLVSAPGVAQPVAVRYGWANVPNVNLFSIEGLPASPFRTDCADCDR